MYQEKVRRFVKKEIAFQPAATKFQVFVVSLEGPVHQQADIEVRGGPVDEATENVVEDVESVVKNAAEAASHVARIRLVARATFRNEQGKLKVRTKGWMEFVVAGEAQNTLPQKGMGSGETEPPTPAGVQAQQMRHNEALMRMSIELMHSNVEYMRDVNRAQAQQIMKFQNERAEVDEEREMLQTSKHHREMEAAVREAKERRMDMILASGMNHLGPVLAPEIAKLVAKLKGSPEAPTANGAPANDSTMTQLKTLVMDDPEMFGEMMGMLEKKDPEKAKKLFELLTAK